MVDLQQYFYPLFFTVLILFSGCASAGNSMKENATDSDSYMTLEDHLRRINGVSIQGTGKNAKVFIRGPRGVSNVSRDVGTSSGRPIGNGLRTNNERQPLFIIDGQKVGRDYADVRDMLGRGTIEKVELLTDAEAARYGGQSGNRILMITNKSAAQHDKGQ